MARFAVAWLALVLPAAASAQMALYEHLGLRGSSFLLLDGNPPNAELKLSAIQRKRVLQLTEAYRVRVQRATQSPEALPEAHFAELDRQLAAQLAAVLSPVQRERLFWIGARLLGPRAMADGEAARAIKLTTEQQARIAGDYLKLQEADVELGERIAAALEGVPDTPDAPAARESVVARFDDERKGLVERRKRLDASTLASLTPAQRNAWNRLTRPVAAPKPSAKPKAPAKTGPKKSRG